jgi:hypothetical protein
MRTRKILLFVENPPTAAELEVYLYYFEVKLVTRKELIFVLFWNNFLDSHDKTLANATFIAFSFSPFPMTSL